MTGQSKTDANRVCPCGHNTFVVPMTSIADPVASFRLNRCARNTFPHTPDGPAYAEHALSEAST